MPNLLNLANATYHCAIGKNGFIPAAEKCEGDMCSPIGVWALRELWYRADRLTLPQTQLPVKTIGQDDGWCDDPKHPMYNQHVKLPFAASHETLWREDGAYDLIIPLGYNDDPVVPGKGSAIFMHCAHDHGGPTAGCVALARDTLLKLLPQLSCESRISIAPEKIKLLP